MAKARKVLKLVKKVQKLQNQPTPKLLLLDIGCGMNKFQKEFIGVDQIAFPGVDLVLDIRKTPWPWKDDSVDGMYTSHFIEHLTGAERIAFFNEAYRVLKPDAQIQVICPDWSNDRAYGDPTHQWPPMSRWSFLYLNEEWRKTNGPHVGYTCNFEGPIGGSLEQWLTLRNEEARMFMSQHYVNALMDLMVVLVKKVPKPENGDDQASE